VELANRLVLGEKETTIGVVYTITEDGRQAAVHERSHVAGSGEKRLVEIKPPAISPVSRETVAPAVVTKTVGDLDAADIGEEEAGVGGD